MTEVRQEIFTEIYESNHWGGTESRSGEGSSIEATSHMRVALPRLIREWVIKSILDVPCGDFNWMSTVRLDIPYIGIDIVEEAIASNREMFGNGQYQFLVGDAVTDKLPDADLVFCRDFLQHMPYEDVMKFLNNVLRTRAKFLLVTSYSHTRVNEDCEPGGYRPLNLFIEPFRLGRPIAVIGEGGLDRNEPDKSMYLMDLRAKGLKW